VTDISVTTADLADRPGLDGGSLRTALAGISSRAPSTSPVTFGNVTFHPRDILHADHDGIVLLVLGGAADGAKAVRLALALKPSVILMALRMPGMDGVAAITELSRRGVAARVLVRAPGAEPLSQRELKVLSLVAAGTTDREAAARLSICEATVKTHLLHIYAKLGVGDRAAAVAEAFNRGLLTPAPEQP
jgi:DNA-binding NarL/FixJ family response regulator